MKRRVFEYGFRLAVSFFIVGAALAADPDYPHGDFSGDCTECHDAERWSPAAISKSWVHPDAFPLVGAHRTATCKACHANLDFKTAPTDCADCHRDAHRGELGTDCARCHRPTNFLDRSRQLDDHRATRFPLVGAHATQDCESCHRMQPQGTLTWVGLDVECVSCHLADYQATTDPDHEASQFPTDCLACHRPTAWSRASVDHDRTGFPLTGRHRTLACSDCHANGFSGTPSACFACHADDYAGTTDPDHEAAGFPTDCSLCHTTSGFDGAQAIHHDAQYFPIYSGRHAGRWNACADCHTQPTNFAAFSCFACHGQSETASHHGGVNGYAYDSNLCYQCHPRGEAN